MIGRDRMPARHTVALKGQLTVLMGPPGSGKSRLLRILAGTESANRGSSTADASRSVRIALVQPARRPRPLVRAVARLKGSERGGADLDPRNTEARRFDDLAAALDYDPAILLADTAGHGCWSGRERERFSTLRSWVEAGRRSAVVVTGDPVAAALGDRVLFLSSGSIVGDLDRPELAEVLASIEAMGTPRPSVAG